MAEIHNYTMNFSCGRQMAMPLGLTSLRELACTGMHCGLTVTELKNASEMM